MYHNTTSRAVLTHVVIVGEGGPSEEVQCDDKFWEAECRVLRVTDPCTTVRTGEGLNATKVRSQQVNHC